MPEFTTIVDVIVYILAAIGLGVVLSLCYIRYHNVNLAGGAGIDLEELEFEIDEHRRDQEEKRKLFSELTDEQVASLSPQNRRWFIGHDDEEE